MTPLRRRFRYGLLVAAGVPGYSQEPVETGGTFTYDFVVPDAGIYWYHPHVMSAAQVGFGLYGAFLVEDPAEAIGIADDLVVALSDIDLTDEGTLASPDTGGSVGMLFGREGNHDWSHPLHLHGFFFMVLDAEGAPIRPLEWKDTVDIPHRQTVRLAVRFDERPGRWIFHCHVLDHAEGGLLSAVHLDLPLKDFRNMLKH